MLLARGFAPTDNPLGRVFCPKELRQEVISRFKYAFNLHPLFSGPAAPNAHAIHFWAVKDIYRLCEEHDLSELWAYLWTQWYRPDRWRLWALASAKTVPLMRTTMVSESHFRKIKHDYLDLIRSPRADLLIHILTRRLQPRYRRKIELLLRPNGRNRLSDAAAWRVDFKKEWKACVSAPIQWTLPYRVTPERWLCECPAFVLSACVHSLLVLWLVLKHPQLQDLQTSRAAIRTG
jgi:hypothetical protein